MRICEIFIFVCQTQTKKGRMRTDPRDRTYDVYAWLDASDAVDCAHQPSGKILGREG